MGITEEYFVVMDVFELEKGYWNKFNYEKDNRKKLPATAPILPTTISIPSTTTTPTPMTLTPEPITTSTTSPPSTSTSNTLATIGTTNPISSGISDPTKILTTNVDPTDITPCMVDATQFLLHTKMTLMCEDDILPFYQNIYA